MVPMSIDPCSSMLFVLTRKDIILLISNQWMVLIAYYTKCPELRPLCNCPIKLQYVLLVLKTTCLIRHAIICGTEWNKLLQHRTEYFDIDIVCVACLVFKCYVVWLGGMATVVTCTDYSWITIHWKLLLHRCIECT